MWCRGPWQGKLDNWGDTYGLLRDCSLGPTSLCASEPTNTEILHQVGRPAV